MSQTRYPGPGVVNDSEHRRLLNASLSSASSLMGLQLFSRLFTFALNQASSRLTSPQVFGTAAIQFEFLLSTILFLSREGVRNAILRSSQTQKHDRELTTNLTLLPFFLGLPLTFLTPYTYGKFAGESTKNQPHFQLATWLYAFAALIELLGEPMHARAVAEFDTKVRVRVETLAILAKNLTTFLGLLYDSRLRNQSKQYSLVAFAFGQLAYGIVKSGTYAYSYWPPNLFPKPILQATMNKTRYFNPDMLKLSLTMTCQSLVKHLLTEGDKLILARLSPLQDQGGYAIAVNYGSLVARIVFQPIEEMSRVFFSKVLSDPSAQGRNLGPLRQASSALLSLVNIQLSFTVILAAFGPPYLPIALQILLPRQYLSTSAPKILSAWIWYIPFLAVNGGLEAFVSSAATSVDLNRQSRYMTGFSLVYVCSAFGLYHLQLGDLALIYANIINLSFRIAYSAYFIAHYFNSGNSGDLLKWSHIWPSWKLCFVTGLSTMLIWWNDSAFGVSRIVQDRGVIAFTDFHVVSHIALGVSLALSCIFVLFMTRSSVLVLNEQDKTKVA